MPEVITDPWLIGALIALASASVATWVWLLARRTQLGYILAYEARQPVPWNVFGTLLAILFVAISLSSAFEPAAAGVRDQDVHSFKPTDLVGTIALQTFFVGAFFAVVVAAFQATPIDLGLPRSTRQAANDICIGAVAWLASIAPVHGLNIIFTSLFSSESKEEHPLIDMMLENPEPLVMVLGTVLAVVIAPLTEEITFRLLFQGWLEKWEDARLGWRSPVNVLPPNPAASSALQAGPEVHPVPIDPIALESINRAYQIMTGPTATSQADELALPVDPPVRGLLGLPYGWLPILLSSVFFAAAHLGFGAMALLPLAVILGYVYQRTHRILPCMVTHALFNLTSTFALWRIISSQAE